MFELRPLLKALLIHFWNSWLASCWFPGPLVDDVTIGLGLAADIEGCTIPPLAVRVLKPGAGAVGVFTLPLAPTVVHAALEVKGVGTLALLANSA